jgi:HlyD family secretion protein
MAAATDNGRVKWNGRRAWVILIALVVAVVVLAAFASMRRSQVLVRIGRAERGTITANIATNGKIEALNNFAAYAPAATTVKKIFVSAGQPAKAGELLLQLEDASARLQAARAQAQLKAAEANLNEVTTGGTQEELLTTRNALVKAEADRDAAQRNLQAMQRLLQSGAASQAEVNAAQSQLTVAEANVHLLQQKLKDRYSPSEVGRVEAQQSEARASLVAARQQLKNSNVVSPRPGTVYSLPVKLDAFVNPGELLVQVADLHKVLVRAFVDEPEIGKLQKGQLVEITWDALPGRVWRGTLDTLPTTVVQRGTRMVGEVSSLLDNDDLKLLPNTNVSVAVVIARRENVLNVPREAVHQDAKGQYVLQVAGGELKRRDITTGVANLTRVEVTSGLSDKAVLALGAVNMQSLREGMQVKVANQ